VLRGPHASWSRAEGASAPTPRATDLQTLRAAFESFATATARLEREYAVLQDRAATLARELEEKNRLLAESVARERRLEAEALRQSRLAAMGEMAAMLAHEVRNPLGAMELFTGLLLQDLREQPEAQRLAQQVARGIVDLNHLVANLLEFTRTREARRAVVDCCALVEDALRYTADLRAAGCITLERRYAVPLVPAVADPELLRPVLLNLIRNAVQAMDAGGTLTVAAASHGDRTAVRVTDTGCGIPAEAREEIFRPFYTTRTRGTGLGLSVARGLVVAMGGELTVESEVGRGTTFTVWLPGAPAPADEPAGAGEGEGGQDAS
jgi:signal transduction histidine kinase